MSRKSIVMLLALAMLATLAGTFATAHGDMPDVIVIDKAQAKKPPVTFPHEVHAGSFDCVTCHHTAKGKDDAESCFNCHGKNPDAPDPSSMSQKENPFHIRCVGCHKEQAKGPTKCNECHKS
ncbi:MAG: cytochrome c3 family protein [bacterium]|nr:MAG: cytochrome c3 family protein [bacterium]